MFLHLRGGKPLTRISRANWKKNLSKPQWFSQASCNWSNYREEVWKKFSFRRHSNSCLPSTSLYRYYRRRTKPFVTKVAQFRGFFFHEEETDHTVLFVSVFVFKRNKIDYHPHVKENFYHRKLWWGKNYRKGKFQFERYTIPWEPYWFFFSTKLANILEVFCTITLIDNLDIFIWHISRWTHNKFEIIILQPNQVSKLPLLA